MSELPHFDRTAIESLDQQRLRDALAQGLAMVSRGAAVAPVRSHIDFGDGAGTYLISGSLPELDLLSVKVINVRPANTGRGLERLQGSLAVFEASTGLPLATLDARAVTEARTAACSAISAGLMARPERTSLAIFGTGPQARAHVHAMCALRPFDEIRVVGHSPEAAAEFAAEFHLARACDPSNALRGAGIVVTATNSATPLFDPAQVEAGTHLALVGSGNPAAAEVAPELLAMAEAIRVDHRPSCLQEAGDIVGAIAAGAITAEQVRELGEVIAGNLPGRLSSGGITIYKSVGNGTQDAALAALLLGRGTVAR